jgi:hypothetical protein
MSKYQVDRDVQYMYENWGTKRLITDYNVPNLQENKKKNTPPEDRMSRPCGGKNGFDDYVERWH